VEVTTLRKVFLSGSYVRVTGGIHEKYGDIGEVEEYVTKVHCDIPEHDV